MLLTLFLTITSLRSLLAAGNHPIDADKKLSPSWLRSLTDPGRPEVYKGAELNTIGMPCGGICAGQVYVRGDGSLAYWWIDNTPRNTGYGNFHTIKTPNADYVVAYQTHRPPSPFGQGMAIRIQSGGKRPIVRKLNQDDFNDIRFLGEYPIATIDYRNRRGETLPVDIQAEVFSPFIPLNTRASANPGTILCYTVKNTSDAIQDITLAGWLQNGVCLGVKDKISAESVNRVVKQDGYTGVLFEVQRDRDTSVSEPRVRVFDDFEGGSYANWTIQGEAFGEKPATGTLKNQNTVSGFQKKYLVNSYLGGDDRLQGKLVSKTFRISDPYIGFLVGGGSHKDKTCMNLVIGEKIVRSITGKDNEALELGSWKVSEFRGQEAHLEIIDQETGPWGHINIDYIHFSNVAADSIDLFFDEIPQRGTMALAVRDEDATATADGRFEKAFLSDLADDGRLDESRKQIEYPLGESHYGAVASRFSLKPGEKKTVDFMVAWCFPNRKQSNTGRRPGQISGVGNQVGNMYSNWYKDALGVVRYFHDNFEWLNRETHLFRDAYYHQTTLPQWFVRRIAMPVSTLATETCQWWASGRFWAWEGVGCCQGTCTHVWNYEHAMARLFPELERSARIMQDYGEGFDDASGLVGFRSNRAYAADGQCGTILKTYREHLMSSDDSFLKKVWPRAKNALLFLMKQDGNDNGLIENSQHNTFDINFEGANTFVGSLYLAALRAGEEMGRDMNDAGFAERCRKIYESGRRLTLERLWDGEYFIHEVDLKKHPKHQYGKGCLSDQLFGQGWAHQLNLGYIYPSENVLSALRAVWKYNWTPDTGPYNKLHKPGRWFANPGEPGLFTCTWPKSDYLPEGVRYKNEVWTGIEYQVANHMFYEGMLKEAFSIVRGVHERYHPLKHNPWNEIECGDHYARAMASWGCLLGISGYSYHGPQRLLGFAPRVMPEDFQTFFTGSEGWGVLSQKRQARIQTNTIALKWGRLYLRTLTFELPEGVQMKNAALGSAFEEIKIDARQDGNRVIVTLGRTATLGPNQNLTVQINY